MVFSSNGNVCKGKVLNAINEIVKYMINYGDGSNGSDEDVDFGCKNDDNENENDYLVY